MKNIYRFTAFIGIAALMSGMCETVSYGSEPDVSTDEGVYINLDYYGSVDDISIVKSCNLNGNRQFVDYGSYDKVINMTNYAEPEIDDDKVTWNLDDDSDERFYYECIPKEDEIILPWTFDISYKLNGVKVKAEELPGAKGMVEINIKADPNEDACDYYKNNMILQAVAMINTQDTLSIEAPGAQMQSLGTYKGILFMGLPGEENEFTIRIGSDSFEMDGIEMMMIPGTLNQLKKIKELKESKDILSDSADDLNESLDDILDTFNNMNDGLIKLKSGLRSIDDGREVISNSKSKIYDDSDNVLDDMEILNNNISDLVPHIERFENCIDEVNGNVNTLVDTSMVFKEDFTALRNSIKNIQRCSSSFKKMIEKLDSYSDERQEIIRDLKEETDDCRHNIKDIDKEINNSVNNVNKIINKIEDAEDELDSISSMYPGINLDNSKKALDNLKDKMKNLKDCLNELDDLCDSGKDIAETMKDGIDLFDKYCDTIENQSDNAENLIDELNKAGDISIDTLNKADSFIDRCENLNDTLNKYKKDSIDALKDSEETIKSMNSGISSLSSLLRDSRDTLRESGKSFDTGSEKSFNALDDLIDEGLNSIENTKSIRKAKNTIKNTIDDEVDKYEEDTNVLNMDYEHSIMSVTSDKNPSPSSIQIVLRTAEINLDDADKDNNDLEKERENIGLINRLKAVADKMISYIANLF